MLNDKRNMLADGMLLSAGTADGDTMDMSSGTGAGAAQPRRIGDNVRFAAILHGAAAAGGTSLQARVYSGVTAGAKTTLLADSGTVALANLPATPGDFPLPIAVNRKLGVPATHRWLTADLVIVGTFTGTTAITISIVPTGGVQTAQQA